MFALTADFGWEGEMATQQALFDHNPYTVADFIEEGQTYDYTATAMLEWAIGKGYISPHAPIDLTAPRSTLTPEQEKEFYHSQKWDVIVFGGSRYLANEAVSYDEARRICSHPSTRDRNWFAGFALHGHYTKLEDGDPFYV